MVQRSTPQRSIDDRCFPIRLKVIIPTGGFGGVLNEMLAWLSSNLPSGYHAHHSSGQVGISYTLAFYFRRLEDARRFIAAFPQLKLADGIDANYRSPTLPTGGRPV